MKIPFVGNSPIKRNIIANLFGVSVNLVNQILLVPFYIVFWGNDLYSDWIVISSLTAFFSMSDIGLNNVIQNQFSIKLAEGKIKECNSLLTDNILIVTVIFILAMIVAIGYVLSFDIVDQMNIRVISRKEASIVFVILVCRVFLMMYSGIENAIYRAKHYASKAVYIDQVGNLMVIGITFACLWTKTSLTVLCIGLCVPPLLIMGYKYFDSKLYFVYKFSFKNIDWKLLKSLFVPSLSFMSFPLGNAIILQGYTLVVNRYFGADSVVLYNTTRTLCNFVKTALGTIQNSVWPEYSLAYGERNYGRMRYLHKKSLTISLIGAIVMSTALLLFGPFIYRIWTHGLVEFQYNLMIVFLTILVLESLWTSGSVTLMSTNNHSMLGLIYIISASMAIGMGIMISMYGANLYQLTATLILIHIILIVYTHFSSKKLLSNQV